MQYYKFTLLSIIQIRFTVIYNAIIHYKTLYLQYYDSKNMQLIAKTSMFSLVQKLTGLLKLICSCEFNIKQER